MAVIGGGSTYTPELANGFLARLGSFPLTELWLMDIDAKRLEVVGSFPHQLSGRQRRRVAIARALAVDPELILADEPISMLDVSIRMGILNLIERLKEERGIAYLYVTHDLASARYITDRPTARLSVRGALHEGNGHLPTSHAGPGEYQTEPLGPLSPVWNGQRKSWHRSDFERFGNSSAYKLAAENEAPAPI